MPDMISKLIITKVNEVEGEDRTLEFTISTESKDRDGEVIKANGWVLDNYNKNPVVLWAHQYQDPPVGKSLSITQKGKNTVAKVLFADKETYEFADTIYRLAKGGFLNTVSVGFIPLEWEDGDGEKTPRRTYTKQELLEFSIVPVPSNPDALVSARDTGVITVKEFEFVTKPEETDDYIRIPVKECKITATIDISEKEGIKALYCGKEKEIATYLFAKDKGWTMEKAKKWVEDHKKGMVIEAIEGSDIRVTTHEPRITTQDELRDELEFTLSLVKLVGISDTVKDTAVAVSDEIRRLTGSDIPDNIKSPIRGMIAPVLKALSEHHEAHEKCYKLCKDALEEIENGGELPIGEVPINGDDDKDVIAEIVKQILNRRK